MRLASPDTKHVRMGNDWLRHIIGYSSLQIMLGQGLMIHWHGTRQPRIAHIDTKTNTKPHIWIAAPTLTQTALLRCAIAAHQNMLKGQFY